MVSDVVSKEERQRLRELAKKQMEYANLDIMDERRALWYAHNRLESSRPMVVIDTDTFIGEMLPPPQCRSTSARWIEGELTKEILNHEMVGDDRVVKGFFEVPWQISYREFDLDNQHRTATDGEGRTLAYAYEHVIDDLSLDVKDLRPSVFAVDRKSTAALLDLVTDTIGDILPVRVGNWSLHWSLSPSIKVVRLMGLEKMMYAMADHPEELHRLYRFIVDDTMAFVKWQEEEGLLVLNNENHYVGTASYGFTSELPRSSISETEAVPTTDLWANLNSQETVGISPSMFGEFVFPYYKELAEAFGLIYYGCCEPADDIFEDYLSTISNLRKVSVSPWSDQRKIGELLQSRRVIFSRKPSPNYIGVSDFEEGALADDVALTLEAARGCQLEFIYRDVYTLKGDLTRPRRAVEVIRDQIDSLW